MEDTQPEHFRRSAKFEPGQCHDIHSMEEKQPEVSNSSYTTVSVEHPL